MSAIFRAYRRKNGTAMPVYITFLRDLSTGLAICFVEYHQCILFS